MDHPLDTHAFDFLNSGIKRNNQEIWKWTELVINAGTEQGVILPLLASSSWKRLQITMGILPITASTSDELFSRINIDDFKSLVYLLHRARAFNLLKLALIPKKKHGPTVCSKNIF